MPWQAMVTEFGEAIVPVRLRCGPKGDFVFDVGPNSAAWALSDAVKFKHLDGSPAAWRSDAVSQVKQLNSLHGGQ